MDCEIEAMYKRIYADLIIDHDEAAVLNDYLIKLNPPPDKLTKLRSTAFKMACNYMSDDKEINVKVLRLINCIVHAIEQNCMEPVPLDGSGPLDVEAASKMYSNVFHDLTVDLEDTQSLRTFFQKTNPPEASVLVEVRALVFKIGCDFLSDNDKEHNVQLLRCINVVVHAFETVCYKPKHYELRLEKSLNLDMKLSDAVQHLWNLDANRLSPGEDYIINVQKGKKPFWKEDSASDPLFTFVDAQVWKRPTYAAFVALLDNYIAQTGKEETVSDFEKKEISHFLDSIMETAPMQFCHQYCHIKNPSKVPKSSTDFRRMLQSIWFELYRRERGGPLDSSGFEHVFVGEEKNDDISGFHNWIQFYLEEKKGSLDYRGYIKPRSDGAHHDENDHLLTLQFAWHGVEKFVGTSFIGVSPEFEMALYSMCFLVGEEENEVHLKTGTDTFGLIIKCHCMSDGKIGTTFPEVMSHFKE